jgi:tellurite resistance protein
MEVIVFLVIAYVVISAVLNGLKKAANKLKMQVIVEKEKRNDIDITLLKVQIKGSISVPSSNYETTFFVKAIDITGGKESPIFSLIERFQIEDSTLFGYTEKLEIPYTETLFKEWATVMEVPVMFLEFPRKGNRTIKLETFIFDKLAHTLKHEVAIVSIQNNSNGYLDVVENREKFEKIAIKTAFWVAYSDGDIHESEANVIKGWASRRLSEYNQEHKEKHKSRLNLYIKNGYAEGSSSNIRLKDILNGIDDIASDGEKYEILELCLKVASSDGVAEDAELKNIDHLAKFLGLERAKYQLMIEKELPITMHASKNNSNNIDAIETRIGITPDMSIEEKRKHLIKEYAKWNARVSNADPKIREQAEEMIKIISEIRKKYK